MTKLILIDGSSILSTSFYGNIPNDYYNAKSEEERAKVLPRIMQTSKGEYTNGIFTMLRILLKIYKQQKPTHIAVAWDRSRKSTFRKEMYDQYKANRSETPAELRSQFVLMQKVLDNMNIPQLMHERYEADDIIGTLSSRFQKEVPTFLLTKDQDALQLVDQYTRLWLVTSKAAEMKKEVGITDDFIIPDNTFEFTPELVKYFYNLEPIQIIDMKAMEGDTSDNIPGIKGVGPKAAVPLLQEFGTVEAIYEHIEGITDKKSEAEFKDLLKRLGISRSPLANLLKESDNELVGKKAALLSKQLATIDRSCPVCDGLCLDDLKLNINEDGIFEMLEYLEFKSLYNEFFPTDTMTLNKAQAAAQKEVAATTQDSLF